MLRITATMLITVRMTFVPHGHPTSQLDSTMALNNHWQALLINHGIAIAIWAALSCFVDWSDQRLSDHG